jgi:hypothetical protein
MSISSISSSISREQKDIADLVKKLSDETKKELDLNKKINQIRSSINNSTSMSSLQQKMRDIERAMNDIHGCQKRTSDLLKRKNEKETRVARLKTDLIKEEERERNRVNKRIEDEYRRIESTITNNMTNVRVSFNEVRPQEVLDYDFFISHASEDKEDFVRPLADALVNNGAKVWYDTFSLSIGDSLRRSIENGLKSSRYGIVVLSLSFFKKEWPQKELDALFNKESDGEKVVLPIWHKVTRDEVKHFSPMLVDKVALNTAIYTIDEIANSLVELIK